MWLIKLIVGAFVAYAGIVALVYILQTRMLFPARLASAIGMDPSGRASKLEVVTPDNVRLEGVRVPPEMDMATEPPIILGFGGNAWNAQYASLYLSGLFPGREVIVFHYRGYGPSGGRPSAESLLLDSVVIFDRLHTLFDGRRVVAIGFSIGSGVAAHLAAKRPVDGLILVSPFDSLEALASEHYPWLPVRWLFRHHMEPEKAIRMVSAPTAVIAAADDTVIPPRRTEAMRKAIPNLVLDRTIPDADHNSLYDRAEFRSAMLEALDRIEMDRDRR
jgi:pimeloyl-ACP methyl ester carboxylesterase